MMNQPLPSSLSPSRLSDFNSCPRRFQYGAIDRVPAPTNYAFTKGNVVHKALELLYLRPADERTWAVALELLPTAEALIYTDKVRADLSMTPQLEATLRRDCRSALETYFDLETPGEVPAVQTEQTLVVEVDGVPLRGIIDRLDVHEATDDTPRRVTIVDYKTGAMPAEQYRVSAFANTDIYAAMYRATAGDLPSGITLIYLGRERGFLDRPVTEVNVAARMRAVVTSWGQIHDAYDAGFFAPDPGPKCRGCPFRDHCRAQGVPVP
jgi:putative RecB family exonuclease